MSAPFHVSSRRGVFNLRVVGRTALFSMAIFWLIPIVIVILTAFRTLDDFLRIGYFSLPHPFTLASFGDAWQLGAFGTVYRNSLVLTLVKVPLGVLLAALISYTLAKLRIRFATPILFLLLIGLTIPTYLVLLPIFILLRDLNLIDTIWGLVPPYIAFGLPFEILVLRAYFNGIPDELLEAARVDGATELTIFSRIILPLSLPVLAAVFIIDAVGTWNELLFALVILSSPTNYTVPLGMLNFQGQFTTQYTALSAGILLAVVPILVLYIAMQRYLISGLTTGSLKG